MSNLKHILSTFVIFLLASSIGTGQVFFTENFDYADGDLDTVSGSLWTTHSGADPQIQVVEGSAIVTAPGSFDHNRLTGVVAGSNDIWFYSVRFSVELGESPVNNDYFVHFKDDSVFGFNARLALDDPADAANDFSLSIWASSEGDGQEDWNGDFMFGEVITCVVRWNNGTGEATLWVNPVDENSTNITDEELADAMRLVESVALRQDSGFTDGDAFSSIVTVEALAAGTEFAAVLDAISEGTKVLVGDVNCDGAIDLLDVAPFVALVTAGDFNEKADINGDGTVDLLDVAPFVTLLTTG